MRPVVGVGDGCDVPVSTEVLSKNRVVGLADLAMLCENVINMLGQPRDNIPQT